MTKPFQEKTVQPSYSTYNSRTDLFPHYHGSKKKNIIKIYNASEKFYSDQTGSFPITYIRGNKYVHGEPLKSCNASDLAIAYTKTKNVQITRSAAITTYTR